jgi:hypothetical protein
MTKRLKTLSFVGVAAACAVAGYAQAADQPGGDKGSLVEKAFGSTIVSTYPDGRQGELWLQRDGTYTAEGRRQDPSNGRWQIKGDKLCLKQQRPFPAPFSYCTPMPSDGIERPWASKAYTGEAINIRLVRGMHGRDAGSKKKADGKDKSAVVANSEG